MHMFQVDPSAKAEENDWLYVVVTCDGRFKIGDQADSDFRLLRHAEIIKLMPAAASFTLGWIGCSAVKMLVIESVAADDPQFAPLSALLLGCDSDIFAVLSTASQVLHWDKEHRYCGICGAPTRQVESGADRFKFCDACKHPWYPRISPCMICVVVKGDTILLAKNRRSKKGWYSALAGFVEPGESVEQAVHREVAEEVGIKVSGLRYVGSQAWSFPHQLMIGYICEYESGSLVLADDEIEDAAWFKYDQLPLTPPVQSLSGQLIAKAQEDIAKQQSVMNGKNASY